MTKPAGVVRVIARMNIGGPALQATDLSAGLGDRFPTVLVTGEVADGEADLVERARARGVRVVKVPELGRRLRPWHDLVALARLVSLLRRERPAIVHTHTAKAGTLGRVAALLTGVPVRVHTFHGHVFHGYFPPIVTRLFVGIERLLARVTTRVVTVSEGQARELVETYRICGWERMRVVPLGFDLTRFHPTRSGALGEEMRRELGLGAEPVVTIVGRLAPIKNHDLFLRVAARLVERGSAAHFLIAGGGSEEGRLRRLAEELGVESRVHFVGWRDDLERVYAGSDVVVLTSANEGTPVCLIEALAAGRAVVATDVGGVRDVLEGGRLGELVPAGDRDGLVAAIEALLEDSGRRAELERAGPEAAFRRFGVERLLHDMTALYDELSSARARPIPEPHELIAS